MKSFYRSQLYVGYFPLLHRYARWLTNNEQTADTAALQVLWSHYCTQEDVIREGIRTYLKTQVLNHCICITQLNIFNRSAIKLPLKPRHHNILNQPSKTSFL